MSEIKLKNNNYINIQGWMILELGLKGNELLTYAVIHGFSQDGSSWYQGSRQYLADCCSTSTRTITTVLASLVEKGLLIKREKVINGVTLNDYAVDFHTVEKFSMGMEKLSTHINTDNNNIKETSLYKSMIKDKEVKKAKAFTAPDIEEIKEYVKEKGYSFDANDFYDHYESNGWMVGKNKMKDWKAACRTWERRVGEFGGSSKVSMDEWEKNLHEWASGSSATDSVSAW